MSEDALKPCPFCGGEAERLDIDGGSCVSCKQCLACSNLEFGFKENFIGNWNRREAPDEITRLRAEAQRLTEALRYYENPEIYKPHPHGPAFDRRDLSYVARAALKALGEPDDQH